MIVLKIGGRIAELRNQMKMSRKELADKLEISEQTLTNWETGVDYPNIQLIPQISKVLETTADYLFGSTSKQQKALIWNLSEGNGGSGNARNHRRKHESELNDKYLSKGWKIIQSHLSSEKEATYMMVVIERDD